MKLSTYKSSAIGLLFNSRQAQYNVWQKSFGLAAQPEEYLTTPTNSLTLQKPEECKEEKQSFTNSAGKNIPHF